MVPKGLNAFGSFSACSRERQLAFSSILGPEGRPQNGVFLTLCTKLPNRIQSLSTTKNFLLCKRDMQRKQISDSFFAPQNGGFFLRENRRLSTQ